MNLHFNTKTRIKITLIAVLVLIAFAGLAVFRNMENLAISCIAALMTVLTTYIWAQTKRPSRRYFKKSLSDESK